MMFPDQAHANLWAAVQIALALASVAVITSAGALIVAIMEHYRARWREMHKAREKRRGPLG